MTNTKKQTSLNKFLRKQSRRRPVVFLLALCVVFTAVARQSPRVYLDQKLPTQAKTAIYTAVELLAANKGERVQLDSVNRFSGSGIYFTTRDADYYRQAPAALAKLGEEAIFIQSNGKSVYAVGNSALAVQHAVFTYLDRIGIRFYFPDPAWHVRPAKLDLFKTFQLLQQPDFSYRSIFMGWGYGSETLKQKYLFWEKANRMGGALPVRAGHIYQRILADRIEEFKKHPEYLSKPLLNGKKQKGTSFNYASSGLIQLTYEWLVEQFDRAEKRGDPVPMLSLEPFDGPNYCDLPECQKIGKNTSDQVFYFANQVARKLKKTHPDKWIGLLAYYDHIDIPKYDLEDNIFITLTSAYNTSSYSIDQLIERWKSKVGGLGMYDYMSVFAATNEMPGRGFGGNYATVARIIRKYRREGIVAYQAESTYGWITKGISHYLASRLLWDATTDTSSVLDQFYKDCFPNTAQWIRPVFASWTRPFIMTENDIYNWFSAIRSAMVATTDQQEMERLHQLALYIRYVTLFNAYYAVKADPVKSRKAAIELTAYMNAVQETGVLASYAGLQTLAGTLGKDFAYNNKSAVWRNTKPSVPEKRSDWTSFFATYLPTLQRMAPIRHYSGAPFVESNEAKSLSRTFKVVNKTQVVSFNGKLVTIIDTEHSDSLQLKISGGRIKPAGTVGFDVYPWNDQLTPTGKVLKSARFAATKKFNTFSLSDLPRGRYLVVASDSSNTGAHLYFPKKLRYSIIASPESPANGGFYNNYYIYVPKNTSVFYITKTHYFQLFDPNGKRSAYATQGSKLVEIKVNKEQWGWWRVQMQLQNIYFQGIPPLMSRDPESYFLP